MRVKMLIDKGAGIGSASAIILAEWLLDAIIAALPVFLVVSEFLTTFGLEVGIVFFVFLAISLGFLYLCIKRPERADAVVERLYPALKKVLKEEKAEKICCIVKRKCACSAMLQGN